VARWATINASVSSNSLSSRRDWKLAPAPDAATRALCWATRSLPTSMWPSASARWRRCIARVDIGSAPVPRKRD
jgi:hypothetical protein